MAIFSKILLRTKISGAVLEGDLENREIVLGNIEKILYIKDYDGNMLPFARMDDTLETNKNVWSAQKIQAQIGSEGIEWVFSEEPTGHINGINIIYTSAFNFQNESLEVFLNGIRLEEGLTNDFKIDSNNQFSILCYAPLSGDTIRINYIKI